MDEQKQNSPKTEQVYNKPDKKTNRDLIKWLIIGLAIFMLIVLIFSAGMFVGGTKARFSYRWAESYHKNFAGPRAGFFGNWQIPLPPPGDFIEGHGTFGEIIKINDSDFIVKGKNDVEKLIIIVQDSVIEKGMKTIKKEELKVGNSVVVIGSPNENGQIEAKLIRIFNGEDIKDLGGKPRLRLFR